jgi:DNA polymerase III subunit beta
VKLTIAHTQFAETVAAAALALPARPPAPVLAGLHLHAADGTLAAGGYDYELHAHATTAARIHEPGTILVPGRLLADIARNLRGEVHLHTDTTRAVLEAGAARFTLPLLPLEEYPTAPGVPPASGTLPGADLAAVVAQVAVAAGREAEMPVLTGVQIDAGPGTVTLTATDRYRVATRTVPWTLLTPGASDGALVPARALLDIAKNLAGDGEATCHLPDDQGMFGITSQDRRFLTRTLEGAFPKVRKLFPTEFTLTATVDSAALAAAVKRAALVLTKNAPVVLHFTAGALTVRAGHHSDAQAIERLDGITTAGTEPQMSLAFNPTYLLEGLTALAADTLHIGCVTPTKPVLLHAAGATPADLHYLLMPIRLSK